MIVQEFFIQRSDGVNLFKTYSDENYYIRKIGTEEIYEEAIDPEDKLFERQYEETDEKIPDEDEPIESVN